MLREVFTDELKLMYGYKCDIPEDKLGLYKYYACNGYSGIIAVEPKDRICYFYWGDVAQVLREYAEQVDRKLCVAAYIAGDAYNLSCVHVFLSLGFTSIFRVDPGNVILLQRPDMSCCVPDFATIVQTHLRDMDIMMESTDIWAALYRHLPEILSLVAQHRYTSGL